MLRKKHPIQQSDKYNSTEEELEAKPQVTRNTNANLNDLIQNDYVNGFKPRPMIGHFGKNPRDVNERIISKLSFLGADSLAKTCNFMNAFVNEYYKTKMLGVEINFKEASHLMQLPYKKYAREQMLEERKQMQKAPIVEKLKSITYPILFDQICKKPHNKGKYLKPAFDLLNNYSPTYAGIAFFLLSNPNQISCPHAKTVQLILCQYDPHHTCNLDVTDNMDSLEQFLLKIQKALIKAKNPLNPEEDLVKRIKYIQEMSGVYSIDLAELCFKLSEKNLNKDTKISNLKKM